MLCCGHKNRQLHVHLNIELEGVHLIKHNDSVEFAQ